MEYITYTSIENTRLRGYDNRIDRFVDTYDYNDFTVQDINQLLNLVLFREQIPIELRAIVNDYYGDSSGDLEGHRRIAEYIQRHMNCKNLNSKLPYIDYTPYEFTACMAYYNKVCIVRKSTNCSIIINPKLFYECFKKVTDDPDYQPPRRTAPSLIPPMPTFPKQSDTKFLA